MTDENSHEDKKKPHIEIDADGTWWKNLENGDRVDVTPKPKRTGDPELDALWSMTARELDEILKDEDHPLHGKAKQVEEEAMAPVREAIAAMMNPFKNIGLPKVTPGNLFPGLVNDLGKQLAESFWTSSGWKGVTLPITPVEVEPATDAYDEPEPDEPIESAPDVPPETDVEDASKEVVDPSMTQREALGEAMLAEMRKFNEHWKQSIKDAKESGEQANRIAEESNALSRKANGISNRSNDLAQSSKNISGWALVISIVAALAAVAAVLVSVFGWGAAG